MLARHEADNPKFSFLHNYTSPEHAYYRYMLYVTLSERRHDRDAKQPFRIFDKGPLWLPPGYQPRTKRVEDTPVEKAVKGMLTSRHKQQLEGYLERAAHDPSAIHNAVQLALNRADAAPMIVDMITAALVDGRADTDSKHARLELLSALLHASGSQVPNAWKLRAEIEKQLPTVYDHLGELYRAIHTRIKAEQFKRQFTQVLFQWQQYSVYPQSFLDSLYDKFKRTEVQSPAKVTTRPAKHPLLSTAALEKIHATSSVVDEDLDGEPLEDLDGEPL